MIKTPLIPMAIRTGPFVGSTRVSSAWAPPDLRYDPYRRDQESFAERASVRNTWMKLIDPITLMRRTASMDRK
jgi:hypothetical protein